MPKIDLHTHSFYSDGSDTIEELIKVLRDNKVEIFSLTDHDTIKGYDEIQQYLLSDIKLVNGIEFTCNASDFECHRDVGRTARIDISVKILDDLESGHVVFVRYPECERILL